MELSAEPIRVLTRQDNVPIPDEPGEVRLFACVRNEERRLPYFLKYYRDRGVSRFFIIDNGSSDDTARLLLSYPETHTFHTADSYAGANYGMLWLRELLDAYASNRWCVVADADEILVYPGCEHLSIPEFCRYLDTEGSSALHSLLVDMYSEKPIARTLCEPHRDPLTVCPYYETESIICKAPLSHVGGPRRRLFGVDARLDKISLFRYQPQMDLKAGMHGICGAALSPLRGAVLHFKFFADFALKANLEASRGEHWMDAWEYRRYDATIKDSPNLIAFIDSSKRFQNSEQLTADRVMRSSEAFNSMLRERMAAREIGSLRRVATAKPRIDPESPES